MGTGRRDVSHRCSVLSCRSVEPVDAGCLATLQLVEPLVDLATQLIETAVHRS
jgi:hypothetical protein